MRALGWFLCLLSAAPGLHATEKASPALQSQRQTSTQREISLKPLFVYSTRGRRDPFTFDASLPGSPEAAGGNFHISELRLVGFLGVGKSRTALFQDVFKKTSYRFKQGQLFSPEGIAISNVKGSILPDRNVSLVQGESSILYKLAGNSRILSLEATIAQDRKELQR